MSDLVERVEAAICNATGVPGVSWRREAIAAIAEVRAFDVERGPSRDEMTAACLAYGGSSFASRMSKSLNAAAKVRAEEVT